MRLAYKILGISEPTYQRWTKDDHIKKDQRPITKMNAYRNRSKELTKKEQPTHMATGLNQIWTWDIT